MHFSKLLLRNRTRRYKRKYAKYAIMVNYRQLQLFKTWKHCSNEYIVESNSWLNEWKEYLKQL